MAALHSTNPFAGLAQSRSRSAWNACLENWEKPATPSEVARIERVEGMIRDSLGENHWLTSQGVVVRSQGSYFNNTNVRTDADMDLRVTHPLLQILYHNDVVVQQARAALRYVDGPYTFGAADLELRSQLAKALAVTFGQENVDATGKKAIRVKELPGSRVKADVVPTFRLHVVEWNPDTNSYVETEGIAILSGGNFTYNFPDLHYQNGVAKRLATALRFKKVVRMLKSLRNELVQTGALKVGEVPSFLVECLAYGVEDEFYLVDGDDRYGRLLRIVGRLLQQLVDAEWIARAREINGIKLLFHPTQPWTSEAALKFAVGAYARLEA